MKRLDPIWVIIFVSGKKKIQTIGRPTNIGLVDLVTRATQVQNIGAYYITRGGFQICLQTLIISLGSFRQLQRPTKTMFGGNQTKQCTFSTP